MKNKQHYLKVDNDLSFCSSHSQINKNSFIRVFDETILEKEFEWHRDENKRFVTVIYADPSNTWQFQFDENLPFVIQANDEIEIEKEEFHKLHKGKGALVLYVQELRE